MARERFVDWNAEPPSWETVTAKAREYFGPSCEYDAREGVLTVTMPMISSHAVHPHKAYRELDGEGTRTVEIYLHDESVNVETRGVDQLTDFAADGLAVLFAWYFKGTVRCGVSRHEHVPFATEFKSTAAERT